MQFRKSFRLGRAVAGLALALGVGVIPLAGVLIDSARAGAADLSAVTSQADWILSAQASNGAIAAWPDRPTLRLVWPYLSNFAAIGLAQATQVTGNTVYAEHSWEYLRWYQSVEQPGTGYVTNYSSQNGVDWTSTGRYDSTDAYAGTYLAAVWDTYSATHDLGALRSLRSGIDGALEAIASTQQSDGLTWATPGWHVAYLMDNVQALGGLEAAAAIGRTLGDPSLASDATRRADAMQAGIASLWNPATGAYDWARQANGWQHPTAWSNLYPDSLEQVAAVEWGAVPASRSAALMAKFTAMQPEWSDPTAMANYLNGSTVQPAKVSYWPSAAIAYNSVGDTGLASSGLSTMLGSAASVHYSWPYTTGDAGEVVVAASGGQLLFPTSGSPTTPRAPGPTGSGGHNPATHTSKTTEVSHPARPAKGSHAGSAQVAHEKSPYRARQFPQKTSNSGGGSHHASGRLLAERTLVGWRSGGSPKVATTMLTGDTAVVGGGGPPAEGVLLIIGVGLAGGLVVVGLSRRRRARAPAP